LLVAIGEQQNKMQDIEEGFWNESDAAAKKLELSAKHDQSALIKLVDASDERQHLYHIKVAEHRHFESQSKENTIRFLIVGLWTLFIVGFIYAVLTKDNTLPKELLTIAITAAGSLKALKFFKQRGNNEY
jgi:hypothetical protein